MNYTEEYYKTGNYKHYLESGERYKRTARDIADLLTRLNLINKKSNIYDFGCGVGFLMQGLEELGYCNVFGGDVSEWAIIQAQEKGLNALLNVNLQTTDILIALDVFEHMEDDRISLMFSKCASKVLICRIPVSEDDSGKFFLDVSNNDKTHINCKRKKEWVELFKTCGYTTFLYLNLISIFDAKGVLCLLCLKND